MTKVDFVLYVGALYALVCLGLGAILVAVIFFQHVRHEIQRIESLVHPRPSLPNPFEDLDDWEVKPTNWGNVIQVKPRGKIHESKYNRAKL